MRAARRDISDKVYLLQPVARTILPRIDIVPRPGEYVASCTVQHNDVVR